MLPDVKIKCPATAFKRSCRSIISKCDCPKFVKVVGTNKNTGQEVDKFGCIDSFLHMLLIENISVSNATTVEMNLLRNEVAKSHDASMVGAMHRLNQRLDEQQSVCDGGTHELRLLGNGQG